MSIDLLVKPLRSWFWSLDLIPYDIGTWTPILLGDGTAGTFTYDAANTGADYTRRGNRVSFAGRVRITAITVAPTGNIYISLPFAPVAGSSHKVAGGTTITYFTGIASTAGYTQVHAYIYSGLAITGMVLARGGLGNPPSNVQGSEITLIGGGVDFLFYGEYRIA